MINGLSEKGSPLIFYDWLNLDGVNIIRSEATFNYSPFTFQYSPNKSPGLSEKESSGFGLLSCDDLAGHGVYD